MLVSILLWVESVEQPETTSSITVERIRRSWLQAAAVAAAADETAAGAAVTAAMMQL